jgi:hypothetical protein
MMGHATSMNLDKKATSKIWRIVIERRYDTNSFIEFPLELQEVETLVNWVHGVVQYHIAQGGVLENEGGMHRLVWPQFATSRYIKF